MTFVQITEFNCNKFVLRCFICSGGTTFTVTGKGLDLVRTPEMIIYFPDGGNITGVRLCFNSCIYMFTVLKIK